MKKILIAIVLLGATGAFASSGIQKPVYTCTLTFSAGGGGVQLILGRYVLKGSGVLSCVDAAMNTGTWPVKVTIGSSLAPNFAAGVAKVKAASANFTVGSPDQVFGNYMIVGGGVALVVGAQAQFGIRGTKNGLAMNLTGGLESGVGAQFGLQRLKIERANQ